MSLRIVLLTRRWWEDGREWQAPNGWKCLDCGKQWPEFLGVRLTAEIEGHSCAKAS